MPSLETLLSLLSRTNQDENEKTAMAEQILNPIATEFEIVIKLSEKIRLSYHLVSKLLRESRIRAVVKIGESAILKCRFICAGR